MLNALYSYTRMVKTEEMHPEKEEYCQQGSPDNSIYSTWRVWWNAWDKMAGFS